jgi:hypothetical protein
VNIVDVFAPGVPRVGKAQVFNPDVLVAVLDGKLKELISDVSA